jgi:rhodanese-related sulfurtransferase
MIKYLWILITAALLVAGCGGGADTPETSPAVGQKVSLAGGSFTDMSVTELQSMLTAKDFTFVNVHIPFEGDIAGTDVSIPFDEITRHLDQLPAKDAKIVLYCRSGRMSALAAEDLVKLGYTDVWNLDGGFDAWEAAGLPLEK